MKKQFIVLCFAYSLVGVVAALMLGSVLPLFVVAVAAWSLWQVVRRFGK